MSEQGAYLRGLELKLPPVVVLALAGLSMMLIDRALPSLRLEAPVLDWAVLILTSLGVLVGFGAVLSFQRARTTIDPRTPEASEHLIRSGLFAWSRNPIYLAMALLLLAYAAKLGHPVAVLMVPIFVAWIQRFQILPEERSLERLFGEAYREYCRSVRRWI